MLENNYTEDSFIHSLQNVQPTDNILTFIHSFEKPNWKYYIPFFNKESTFKFLEFAQTNDVNLFEKANDINIGI